VDGELTEVVVEPLGTDFFAAVLEVIGDGVLVVDGDGAIYYSNPRARELLGMGDGPPLTLLRHAPEIFLHLREALARSQRQVSELTVSYPERRLLRVSCLPLAQKSLHAVVLGDRTAEGKGTDARLEDETCAAVQFLAGEMAHDLGNPLNTLQIHLQLLQRQVQGRGKGNDAAETLQICREEIARMRRLVSHFLGAIRPARPILASLDLRKLLAECVAVEKPELAQRHVTLARDHRGKSATIRGDADQLRRVFVNLLRNAMEALEGGGHIDIRTVDEGAFLRVEIEDNGVGIDPTILQHLFGNAPSAKHSGNGLGLLIVRRILRGHRATLSIGAVEPQGTRVTLRFPLENPRFPGLPGGEPSPALVDRIPLGDGKIF
jgi:signal transduction histidine kinase